MFLVRVYVTSGVMPRVFIGGRVLGLVVGFMVGKGGVRTIFFCDESGDLLGGE